MAPALTERRVLIALLRGMLLAAALLGAVLAWRYASGPDAAPAPPSVRVARLPPASFVWASAPDDPHYLPPELRASRGTDVKLLLLRDPQGALHAFYLPQQAGRVRLPAAGAPLAPGIPCEDLAPDFDKADIACRQATPGFEFALRHRWSLSGRALSAGTPDLYPVPGAEHGGDWMASAQR